MTSSTDITEGLTIAYQPMVDLQTGRPWAYEALLRPESASPSAWLAKARREGAGPVAEALAITLALRGGRPPGGALLAVNVSASALASDAVQRMLPRDLSGLILEITENELVLHGSSIQTHLDDLRGRGALIAVDDAGAGYASLRQVMLLRPDIIKLDRELVSGVHLDPAKVALIEALSRFAVRTGAMLCAEGIEHEDELATLADLDVPIGQGFYLARPHARWPTVAPMAALACREGLASALRHGDRPLGDHVQILQEALAARLSNCTSLADLNATLPQLQLLLQADGLSISRLEDPGGDPYLQTCAGSVWEDEPCYRVADYPTTGALLRTGDAAQVLRGDTGADEHELQLLHTNGLAALMMIPLRACGQAVGLLEVFSSEDRPWTRQQLTLARTVAHHLATLLRHLPAHAQARAVGHSGHPRLTTLRALPAIAANDTTGKA
ncbi:EAL domain-containing protein [Paraconexibacter antarcticus]|uniref:EAL domain-containing protein n=1 Tax=Paraconexibacter antarcticus TaxID=2949664 RepID=A0ABY5DXM5_9ACTN|nr:EAL domain-containing protein [Paraconexibacter antarcticus]UTI64358.1 EAL domain-containing protein [Paraconexibacter antarcticus]UTI66788.1 EAL domain-containing protein [Paraconexibacter antarcticus]